MERERLYQIVWLFVSPTALLSLISCMVYLADRARCLVQTQLKTDHFLAHAWLYFMIEAISLTSSALPYTLRMLAVHKPRRIKESLETDEVPTVDILITCCNEDIDVILDTVRAACVLDYPRDRYRVFVCDDGASNEVKAAVERLLYPHLFYTARVKGPIKDYKAGNLNSGLQYSRSIPLRTTIGDLGSEQTKKGPTQVAFRLPHKRTITGKGPGDGLSSGALDSDTVSESSSPRRESSPVLFTTESDCSEYIAGLDADMIPEPYWLRTILPHLIDDPKMAMACPPQTFYDIPVNDLLTQTMGHFAGITEVVNDALGHADCLGSGYVMRRAAIESIGGFPVESLSEDVCCSACLLGAGWRTAFIQEPVQYGLVPESLAAHIKQRTRWFIGHVQTAVLLKFRLSGRRCGHLNLFQRIAGFAFDLSQIVQVPIVMAYFTIPYALLSGYPIITALEKEDLLRMMQRATIWILLHWTHQCVMGLVAGLSNRHYDIRTPSYGSELDQWLAPYIAESFLCSFVLPTSLGGKKAGFTPSGTLKSSMQERGAQNRAPLHRRLCVTLLHQRVLIHVIFLLATVSGVVLTFARALTGHKLMSINNDLQHLQDSQDWMLYLIVRVGWPPFAWLQFVSSALCPVIYILFPPTGVERESLLVRDEKTGTAYPTEQARRPKSNPGVVWRYLRPAVAMAFTLGLLTISIQSRPYDTAKGQT